MHRSSARARTATMRTTKRPPYPRLIDAVQITLALTLAVLSSIPFAGGALSAERARASEGDRVELTERRTATSKTFRNPDGTLTTSLFTGSIHFRNERGAWQEIDSQLVPASRPGYALANKANSFKVEFKPELEENFLRFEVSGKAFLLALEGAARRPVAGRATGALYKDIFPGVDLKYDLFPEGVKETLILHGVDAPLRYRFRLTSGSGFGLRADRLNDGSWGFFVATDSEPVFVLPRPTVAETARDGEGRPPEPGVASLEVTQVNDAFVIDLALKEEWLREPGRRFPVLLDPTITIQPTVEDANFSVCSTCQPSVGEHVYVGVDNGGWWRGALQFDLSSVPAGAVVTKADLRLFYDGWCLVASDPGHCGGKSHQIDAHRMTKAWSTASRTADLDFAATPLSSSTLPAPPHANQWLSWDVTGAVGAWVGGTSSNHGFLLKRSTEPLSASGPGLVGRRYTGAAELRPKLEVTYSDAVVLYAPETVRSNGAELRWSRYSGPSGAPFQKYEIHRSRTANFAPSSSTLLATIGSAGVTSYRDTTAAPSTSFTYKVVANADPSNEQTISLPAAGEARKTLQPDGARGEGTEIAFISGSVNCANYGSEAKLWIGATETARHRPLIGFDLRDVPADATVASATLSLWHGEPVPAASTVDVHGVEAAWSEGSGTSQCKGDGATWYETEAGLKWATLGGDFESTAAASLAHAAGDAAGWDRFDITALVRKWVAGDSPNLGVLLKLADDTLAPGRSFWYAADDYALAPELRPKLEVAYSDGNQALGPTVSISAPVPGATVSGNVTVAAAASDDGRVDKVEFFANGSSIGVDTAPPFEIIWNTSGIVQGTRTLTATAHDDAGNATTMSTGVEVVVSNSAAPRTAIGSPNGKYPDGVRADLPSAYWRLGETSGGIGEDPTAEAVDSSVEGDGGGTRNGSYGGSYTLGQASLLAAETDTSVLFADASTDGGVTISSLPTTELGSVITAEAFVSYSLTKSGCNRVLSRNWPNSGGWMLAVCRTSKGEQQAQWAINKAGTQVFATALVTPGKLHLVGTYDGAELRLYVNGVQVKSAALSAATLTTSTTAPAYIATNIAQDITIDDAALYNRVLTPTQVRSRYDAGTGQKPAVGGTVSVTATGFDDLQVSRVEFYVDGVRFDEDTTPPYTGSLDTKNAADPVYDDVHTLTAKAYDSGGKETTSEPVSVTVSNAGTAKYAATLTAKTPVPLNADEKQTYGVLVDVKNNSTATWRAADVVVRARWVEPELGADGKPVYAAEVAESALPADLAPGATASDVKIVATAPALADGVTRSQYLLRIDLFDKGTGGGFFADKGNRPLDNPVIVNKTLVREALGLERYYHYVGEELGAGMQHAVNVANGNSIVRWTPFEAPGRGLATVLDLTYNALERKCECPAGNNFSLSISSLTRFGNPIDIHPNKADEIAGRSNKYIELTDGDGTTHRFTSNDGLTYHEPDGVHLFLRRYQATDADNPRYWALTRPDRVTFFYDKDGYPTFVRDKNGNELAFTLELTPPGEDPGGPKKRITKVTDAENRSFALDFYSKAEAKKAHVRGKIERITDHSGSVLHFDYYEDGNLLRLTQRGGTKADGSYLADRSFVFTYTTSDGSGPAITDPVARQNPNARTSNQSTRLFSVIDPRRNETTFAYLGPGNGESRWKLASRTDRAGSKTDFAYDTVNRVTTVTEPLARASKYAYDTEGKVTNITNPKGEATLVAWAARRVTKVTEPSGAYTEYAYNANGYLTDEKVLTDRKLAGVEDDVLSHTKLEYQNVEVKDADGSTRDVAANWKTGRAIPHISQLARKTDPNGMATTAIADDYQWIFAHDTNGNLDTVTDPEGGVTDHDYNANGTLAATTEPNGTATATADDYKTRFELYDANGFPQRIVDANEHATTFGYDTDGLLRWVQDGVHQRYSGSDERAYRSFFDYDSFHRLGRQSAPKSTELERGQLIWSAADYDANDNLVAQIAPHYGYGYSAAGARTTGEYDAMDRQTLETGPDRSVDRDGERTKLEYDAAGRPKRLTLPKGVSTSNPDDFVIQYQYDLLDRVVSEERYSGDGGVRKTHRCYDLAGDLRWLVRPKANLDNAPADCSATPPAHTTRYAYDDAHRAVSETDPLGHAQAVEYDPNDDLVGATDASGTKQSRILNELGEVVEIKQPFEKKADGSYRLLTTRLEYDRNRNLVRERSPRAVDAALTTLASEYSYDEENQLVKVALPYQTGETRTYVHRAYDANGNLESVSLPVESETPAGIAGDRKTSLSYFDAGWIRSSFDGVNPKVHFDYTAEGWQQSRVPNKLAVDELDLSQELRWSYYADGQLQRATDRKGLGSTYRYDANNNLTKADEGQGVVSPDEAGIDVEASWDAFDQRAKVRHQKKGSTNWSFTSYGYDLNGNVATREENGEEATDGTLLKAGKKHDFYYDLADQVTYDAERSAEGDWVVVSEYFPSGREKFREVQRRDPVSGWAVKQKTEWSYYLSGDLKTLKTTNGAGELLESHTLSYEDLDGRYLNGHQTRDVFRLAGPDTDAPCRSADCATSYLYDARERLIEEKTERGGTTSTTVFGLDEAGNVHTETVDGTVARKYEYLGQQLRKLTEGGSTSNFFYDSDGNLDCTTTAAGTKEDCNPAAGASVSGNLREDYAYDHLNRLQSVRRYANSTPTGSADYVSDALDRVSWQKETQGSSTRKTLFSYLGLGGAVAEERHEDGAGVLQRTKSYSYDVFEERVAMSNAEAGGQTDRFSYGRNVHGDVSLLVGLAGQAKAAYGYKPYGDEDSQLTSKNESLKGGTGIPNPLNPYRFNDRRFDTGSNSIDMGARRFSPGVGRFLQRDMFHDAFDDIDLAEDPLTQNRYSFAGGNPISFVELDGHIACLLKVRLSWKHRSGLELLRGKKKWVCPEEYYERVYGLQELGGGKAIADLVLSSGKKILRIGSGKSGPARTRLVPGGGLKAHESTPALKRGHTLRDHVGKSNSFLRARLKNSGKVEVSTFTNRALAEDAISGAMLVHSGRIARWLRGSKDKTLPIEQSFDRSVGRIMAKDGKLRYSSRVRVILRRNPNHVLGYHIRTSYVI